MYWTHDHTRCTSPADRNPHLTLITYCRMTNADDAQHHTPQSIQAKRGIQQMTGSLCKFAWRLCSYDVGVNAILSNMPAVYGSL